MDLYVNHKFERVYGSSITKFKNAGNKKCCTGFNNKDSERHYQDKNLYTFLISEKTRQLNLSITCFDINYI